MLKNKLITVLMFLIMGISVNGCTTNFNYNSLNFALSLYHWDITYNGTSPTGIYLNSSSGEITLCPTSPYNCLSEVSLIGTDANSFSYPFNVTFKINPHSYYTYGGYQATGFYFGIMNDSGNNLNLVTKNFVIFYDTAGTLGSNALGGYSKTWGIYNTDTYKYKFNIEINKITNNMVIRMINSSDEIQDSQTIPLPTGAIYDRYRFFAQQYHTDYGCGASDNICSTIKIYSAYSNITLSNGFLVYDSDTLQNLNNCTVTNEIPIMGTSPYFSQPTALTTNGITSTILYYPSCVIQSEGYEYFGTASVSCLDGKTGTGNILITTLNDNTLTYIAVSNVSNAPGDGDTSVCFKSVAVKSDIVKQNLSGTVLTLKTLTNDYVSTTDANGKAYFKLSLDKTYSMSGYNSPNYPLTYFFTNRDGGLIIYGIMVDGCYLVPFNIQPIYNLSVNVNKNNHNINMELNRVSVYACGEYKIPEGCTTLMYLNKYTDVNGNWNTNNVYINSHYIMVKSHYSDVNYPSLDAYKIIDMETINNYSVYAGLSYGIVQQNEVCISIKDAVTLNEITNVTYSLTYQNLEIIGGVYDSKKCFNSTNNGYYHIQASRINYTSINEDVPLYNGDYDIFMQPLVNTIPSNYLFNVSGYVVDENGNKIPNIQIINNAGKRLYTDSNGYYILANLSANIHLSLTTNTYGEYVDVTRNIAVLNSTSDFNFTLIKSGGGGEIGNKVITFTAYAVDAYDNRISVKGVKISLHCSGYSDKSQLTDNLGKAVFTNAITSCDYSYTATKSGYEPKNNINIGSENNPEIEMTVNNNLVCVIRGKLQLENNTITSNIPNQEVRLIQDTDTILDSTLSDENGVYQFNVECDKTFTVSSTYSGNTQTSTVKTPLMEGTITRDLIFTYSVQTIKNIIDYWTNILISVSLIPLLIIIMFLGLITIKIVDEFGKVG